MFQTAVNEVFPNASVKGCFFHFSQAIYRKVQAEGLQQHYAADTDFALQARMLAAMAFVPAPDVDAAFAELTRNVPEELLPILDYFEDTYLGAVRRGIRRAPRFPATMWSIYDRVTAELPRTNNPIEGWHSALGANAGGHHINLWRFIGILQREEALASVGMTHLLQDRDHPAQRPTYAALNRRVLNLVQNYRDRPILACLQGIAYNFTW